MICPFVHDDDAIGMLDGGQTMGNHERGAITLQRLERFLHAPLGFGIERRGGLVQHENRRVLQQGPRDGDPLLLAAGKLRAAIADAACRGPPADPG